MMKNASSMFERVYRLKLIALGAILVTCGFLTSALGDWLEGQHAARIVVSIVQSFADILVVTGGLGLAIDFFTGREKAEADVERTRGVVRELVPDFTDAVLRGLAVSPDDLRRVASPELLDSIATNALALRLGDEKFASEVYEGMLAQAIRTPERWEDVNIDIRLSSIKERRTAGAPAPSVPLFEVTITWDYTLVPSSQVQKFACVSDREEFRELLSEIPATSTWFLSPHTNLAPTDPAAYQLLTFTVDGEERPIRRSVSKTRQTYSVDLGEEAIRAGRPVKVRHTLRAVITREGHWLQFAMTQPAKDLSLTLDYTNTDIARLQVTDLVSSAKQPWVTYLPQQQPTRAVSIEVPGWLLPQAEVTFIWTLEREASERAA